MARLSRKRFIRKHEPYLKSEEHDQITRERFLWFLEIALRREWQEHPETTDVSSDSSQ